jgi:phosphoadenosine phosphosulfate reductase
MSVRLLQRVADLRRRYGELHGLPLLHALLRSGMLKDRAALVSSFGADSAVLLDMVATVDSGTPIIFLDTGRLFAETHDYRRDLVARLGLSDVRVVAAATAVIASHDPEGDLWRRDPDRCCHLRKTAPLQAALAGFDAWITGRKRFQGGARAKLATIEAEPTTGRIKLNPLAPWSADDIERYRRLRGLPAHPLCARGYRSIGCVPCTRPVAPTEAPRAGRWCGTGKTECGIHRAG